jgi:hypothetical protein
MGQISARKEITLRLLQAVKRTWLFVLALGIAAVSCDPDTEAGSPLRGPEYFPLLVGSYWLYNVDSTHIHLNAETNFAFQLRISVVSSFTNGRGDLTYVMRREKRSTTAESWTAAGTWSAWVDARNAVVVEGNARFIRLQFPIDVGLAWNGNALNSMGGDEFCDDMGCDLYVVSSVDPEVVVVQSDESDLLVKYDVRSETYYRNIGLIKKYMTVLHYCTTEACFGKQFVNSGIRYSQTLIENGQL